MTKFLPRKPFRECFIQWKGNGHTPLQCPPPAVLPGEQRERAMNSSRRAEKANTSVGTLISYKSARLTCRSSITSSRWGKRSTPMYNLQFMRWRGPKDESAPQELQVCMVRREGLFRIPFYQRDLSTRSAAGHSNAFFLCEFSVAHAAESSRTAGSRKNAHLEAPCEFLFRAEI